MLRKIRIILATVMFIGITWLFVDFTGTAHHWFAWMPKLQLLEAILALNVAVIIGLVVLTLILGRIYCSVICPLGIMQDIFGWLGKKAKKNRYTYSKEVKWLRYPMLVLFIIALVAGVGTLFQLLAPYSAFGRIATNLLQPIWQAGNNVLAAIAEHYDSYAFYHSNIWLRALPSLIISALTLVILAVLAWRNGRTYCNTICPVGTILSFFSRFSFLKIHFDTEKCRNCSLCTKNCKAACIDFKTHTVDYSRCVVCGDCIESCKFGALKYTRKDERLEMRNERSLTSHLDFVTDCSLDSDLEMYFPDQYVPSDSERMLLYRELDGLQTDEQLAAYRKRLIDRFGKVPHVGEELMRVVPLRRYGKSLGCEKIVLKQDRMTMFFVSNATSPFYQSEAFDHILQFVATNPRRCNFREMNGKRSMTISDIFTVEDAVKLLAQI